MKIPLFLLIVIGSSKAFSAVSVQLNGNLVDQGPVTDFNATFSDLEIDFASSTETNISFLSSSSTLEGTYQAFETDPVSSFGPSTVSLTIADSSDPSSDGSGDVFILSSGDGVDIIFIDSDGLVFEQFEMSGQLPAFSEFESSQVFGLDSFDGIVSSFTTTQSGYLIPEPSSSVLLGLVWTGLLIRRSRK